MVTLGVVLDNGECVPWEKVNERLGILAELVKDPEEVEYKKTDTSVGRLVWGHLKCSHKAYMDKVIDGYKYYKDMWAMRRGQIIHAGITKIANMKEYRIYDKIGGYTLQGVVDFYDEERKELWEIKTTMYMPKEPKDYWILQAALYKFLLERSGHEVQKVYILCISFMSWEVWEVKEDMLRNLGFDGWLTVVDVEKMVKAYMEHKQSGGTVKDPDVCRYCDYWYYCDKGREVVKGLNNSKLKYLSRPLYKEGMEIKEPIDMWRELNGN